MKPEQGMPCTVCHPNDRYAARVVGVSLSGHEISIIRDAFPNEVEKATRRADGGYRLVGPYGAYIVLGKAEDYRCREI